VLVSGDRNGRIHSHEVMATADPATPSRLAACVILRPTDAGSDANADTRTILYLSEDAGRSWRVRIEDSADVNVPAIPRAFLQYPWHSWDPSCAYASDGMLYFGTGTYIGPQQQNDARVRVHRSFDGGRSWASPTMVADGYYDKPVLAEDPHAGSPHRGTVYLAYINDAHGVSVVASRDGARTFTGRVIQPASGRQTKGSSNPSIATDISSGPFRDRLYVAWAVTLLGAQSRIVVASSADRGLSWSTARVINADVPRAATDSAEDLLPAVAVNRTGVVGVSWYTRDRAGMHVSFTASLDGGETWLRPVEVTQSSGSAALADGRHREVFQAYRIGAGATGGEPAPKTDPIQITLMPRWGASLAHYGALAADAGGVFHPVWIDTRAGGLWTATVRVDGRGERNGHASLASYQDVTQRVALHFVNVTFERVGSSAIVGGDLHVENLSAEPLRGPLVARFVRLSVQQPQAGTVSLVSGSASRGLPPGVVDLTPGFAAQQGRLASKAFSAAIPIRFTLSELGPPQPGRSPSIQLEARILQGPAGTSR
jgi:hypothetical protein